MESRGFSYAHLLAMIDEAASQPENVPFSPFCDVMIEFSRAFESMGAALSFAFSDITSKAEIIRSNFKVAAEGVGLQRMVREEISHGTEREHGDHPSTARTLLRLMWFLNFLIAIISNLTTDKTSKLSKITKRAYDEALAPHHPWPVRLGAAIGIKTVPKRAEFVQRLLGSNKTEEEYDDMFRGISQRIMPIRDALWRFYEENSLTDLP